MLAYLLKERFRDFSLDLSSSGNLVVGWSVCLSMSMPMSMIDNKKVTFTRTGNR